MNGQVIRTNTRRNPVAVRQLEQQPGKNVLVNGSNVLIQKRGNRYTEREVVANRRARLKYLDELYPGSERIGQR